MKKVLKILKIMIVVQSVILVFVLIKPYMHVRLSQAAHNLGDVEQMIVTVTLVQLNEKENAGPSQIIFQGKQDVEITSVGSLGNVVNIPGNVPSGNTYAQIRVDLDPIVKVKGTVVLDGKTYYTKANHTNYDTAPAELEEINRVNSQNAGGVFPTPLKIEGNVTIRILAETLLILAYWDGNGSAPTPEQKTPGMTTVPFAAVAVVGEPGSKEVYDLTNLSGNSGDSKARLTLLFDSAGGFIGGMGRSLLKNSSISSGIFLSGGGGQMFYEPQSDGTITIKNIGGPTGKSEITLTGFRRTNHSGNFSNSDIGSGTPTSGTYSAVRVQ